MELRSLLIVIISPQDWSNLSISKHHYAQELAKRGNKVFFVTRSSQDNGKIEFDDLEIPNLSLVRFGSIFSRKIRFHFPRIYSWLMFIQAKRIIRKINAPIDVVWSFDAVLFPNLNWFNAAIKIFHPVDFMSSKQQLRTAKSADFIFSVTQHILDQFKSVSAPKYFINHGLSSYYQNYKIDAIRPGGKIRFAYIGNICMNIIDRESLKTIVSNHPDIQFDFYGSAELKPRDNREVSEFLSFLKGSKNANLKGLRKAKELAVLLRDYDGFLLCYRPNMDVNQGGNSHKLLEYLSLGKLIISSLVSNYEAHRDLIQMSKFDDNRDYVTLFDNAIKRIEELNSLSKMRERQSLALENTYEKQIRRIERILDEAKKSDQ